MLTASFLLGERDVTFELNLPKLMRRINAVKALEEKAESLREELQEPLEKLLKEAGLGYFRCGEKITSLWDYADGGLNIDTEMTRGEWDTFTYRIPASIVKAADPMVAAAEYKRQKASEADDRRRAQTLAEIERLKRTL